MGSTLKHYELAKEIQSSIRRLNYCFQSAKEFSIPYKSMHKSLNGMNIANLADALASDIGVIDSFVNLQCKANIENVVREQFSELIYQNEYIEAD